MGQTQKSVDTQENKQKQVHWLEGYFQALLLGGGANNEQLALLKEKVDALFGGNFQGEQNQNEAALNEIKGGTKNNGINSKKKVDKLPTIDEAADDLPF